MFLVLLHYTKPMEEVDAALPAHVEFLASLYREEKLIVSGRKIPRTGGVMLANASSEEVLWETLRKDPFYQQQLAEYTVIPFSPTKWDPRFACFTE